MDKNTLVEVEDVNLSRDGLHILRDISMKVEKEQVISIIGPNGGGKTTLARILAGIIRPQTGQVSRNEDLRIGYVPQNFELDYLMPITVDFFLRLSPYFNKKTALEIMEELDISHLLKKQFNQLSGGEKQRVLLARAILINPNLIILDEPTQGLDMDGNIKFYELISAYIPKMKAAVVLISHDLNFVMSRTQMVFCLHNHLCCYGKPRDISNNPQYLKLFGRDFTSNLAVYKHRHDHSHP